MLKLLPCALVLLCCIALTGCDSSGSDDSDYKETSASTAYNDSDDEESDDDESGSGNVHYYSPNRGTVSDYTLDVKHDANDNVERINFENGGWIDHSHITDQTHNGDGTITLETDTGLNTRWTRNKSVIAVLLIRTNSRFSDSK
ncbi:hypothetical protein EU556_14670 [Hymenobacter fodinae]|uniref:Uncharacterized protein n=1 Tax=Hymenobacter fodinae TaxID=2510796 RepID=A0A4Z0P626_9BACT|nr:hypothetical protein EU556_14670 [Hymenobacter fodinae]